MSRILVLGAGRSTPYLIRRLLDRAPGQGWHVTVADVDPGLAAERVAGHPRGSAVPFDVNDAGARARAVEDADLVVNMLAPRFQDLVAWDCLAHGTHMLSASYRDEAVREMDGDARRRGVLLLCELGLDPGIDHMSAMSLLDRLRGEGARVRGFRSYGSGVPSPESAANPLRYAVTWNPRNVAMAGEHGAQFMEDGCLRLIPSHQVFAHTWPVEIEGVGRFEAYPNRDSMPYMESFGLAGVDTMIRGTLRYPGFCEVWQQVVRLGLPNEDLHPPRLAERSYRELVEMFLPRGRRGERIEERTARYLGISPTGAVMEKLAWLGLFSDETIGGGRSTPAQVLADLLARRLPLPAGGTDLVILRHEVAMEPAAAGAPTRVTSTLVARGDSEGTAMARTVGLPTAIAAELVLAGEIALTGSRIPTDPSIEDQEFSGAVRGGGGDETTLERCAGPVPVENPAANPCRAVRLAFAGAAEPCRALRLALADAADTGQRAGEHLGYKGGGHGISTLAARCELSSQRL